MHEVVDESPRKKCSYRQSVPQHYYFLDTLVQFFFNKFLFVKAQLDGVLLLFFIIGLRASFFVPVSFILV